MTSLTGKWRDQAPAPAPPRGAPPAEASAQGLASARQRRGRAELIRTVLRQRLAADAEYQRYGRRSSEQVADGLLDYLFAVPGEEAGPDEAFARLRWGGQFVFVARRAAAVDELARHYTPQRGFVVERQPARLVEHPWGLPIPWLTRSCHYFVARKVMLVQPGQMTDRFTYRVELVKHAGPQADGGDGVAADPGSGGYVVRKAIPDPDHIIWRLRSRFPEAAPDLIAGRARKLMDKVFPVFLTREAAFLQILQRNLPPEYAARVPKVLGTEKDERGLVRTLYMNWLRSGGETLSQLDFATQAMDLLRALHEKAQVIHLDLRLDNVVITERGVGFVDFGSAVRVGEDLSESPMLSQLFEEMMWTSSIQKTLGRLKRKGKVTSPVICDVHHKMDKAIDLFNLSLRMNEPRKNPDLADLVRYDPRSREAKLLAALSRDVLSPRDAANPPYKTAAQVLEGMARIRAGLA